MWFGYSKWIDHEANVADAAKVARAAQLESDKKSNETIQQLVQQDHETFSQLVTFLTDKNNSLVSAIGQRNTVVQKQQQADLSSTADVLAQRMQALLKVQPTDVQLLNNNFVMSKPAFTSAVFQLESVSALEQDLKDGKMIVENKDKEIESLNTFSMDLGKQVAGLQTQITDQDKACKANIADLKAQQRKKSRNWFFRGLAIGATVASIAIHAL